MFLVRKKRYEGIPRWQLEGGSRKRASYSEILGETLETHFAGKTTEKR
jgi:hypothetical protein